MSDLRDQLSTHLAGRAAPFLFVGAGFGIRYLGLDGWEALLRRFAEATGRQYERYAAAVDGDYPKTASAIADAFYDIWWDSDDYADTRASASNVVTRRESPLKFEVARYVKEAISGLDRAGEFATELDMLSKVQVDGIITTNYDCLLEELFPDFEPFIGQEQLLFSEPQGIGEIYKIHGCCTSPDSLVLTGADYEDFNSRNAYLAAKLLTIFVDHPVVFLGYSMQDTNVNAILQSVAAGLTTENLGKLQDRLIFIEYARDASSSRLAASTFSLQGKAVPVLRAEVSEYSEVFGALAAVQRSMPIKHLRWLKERVYELVKVTDPVGALRVVDLDDAESSSDIKVVAGVGPRMNRVGLAGVDRFHLFDDVLTGSDDLPARELIEVALPGLLRRTPLIPVYKYLRASSLLDDEAGLTDPGSVPSEVRQRVMSGLGVLAPSPPYYATKGDEIATTIESFDALVEEVDSAWKVLMYVTRLRPEQQQPESLRRFLIKYRDENQKGSMPYESQWAKGVCFYDWLVHGPRHHEPALT